MIVWLVGMSGAGKSTIGREVHRIWKASDPGTVLVDGDTVRAIFRADQSPTDYSIGGRRQNAERIVEICKWLDGEGLNVVCCILAIFPDILSRNREEFSNYFEVFVDAPLERLVERDVKGVYGSTVSGSPENVVGLDIPFPRPVSPDLVIDNGAFSHPPEDWAHLVLKRAGISAGP